MNYNKGFWILQARSAVKSACGQLMLQVQKLQIQTKSLSNVSTPKVHVKCFCKDPITLTGMDYFGPMNVTIGLRHEKRYSIFFTCLTVRSVHLKMLILSPSIPL